MLNIEDLRPNCSATQFEIFKPFGLTPKDVIDEIIQKTGATKATFNGRLDPMACGCMRIFLDGACRQSQLEMDWDKIYRFKMGLGLESSSHDLLGFPRLGKPMEALSINQIESQMIAYLDSLKTRYVQELPHFSSFRVANHDGIKQPLWWWKKNNKMTEVKIPSFERKLYDFSIIRSNYTHLHHIADVAIERISHVRLNHEFNQQAIIQEWQHLRDSSPASEIAVFEMQVSVSSGFYIRKLVEDIGLQLGLKTITIEIERLCYFQSAK
jgi:tRNA pseudouridine55 synthase